MRILHHQIGLLVGRHIVRLETIATQFPRQPTIVGDPKPTDRHADDDVRANVLSLILRPDSAFRSVLLT